MASKDKQRSSEPVFKTRRNTNPDLNVTVVEIQLKDLNDELQQVDLKDWPDIFNNWCSKVIATSYPDIGIKAYAVPYHFQGKFLLAPYINDTQRCLDAAPSQEKSSEANAKEQRNVACPGKEEKTKQTSATGKTKKAPTKAKPGKQTESGETSAKKNLNIACPGKEEETKKTSATGKTKKASTKAKPGKQTGCSTSKEQAETEPRKKRLSLEDSQNTFVTCVTPDTELKGDRAHRIVGRAFRIQNGEFERTKQKTMFIMSQLNYDNLLPWLRKGCTDKIDTYLSSKDYPHVFENPNSYIDIVEIEQQLGDKRGELDFMILHQEKGIILVQVKHISSTFITKNAGSSSTETNAIPASKIQEKVSDASKQLEKDKALLDMMMKRSRHWHQDGCTKVTRVVAVPRLSREEIKTFDLQGHVESDIIFLCKDDMLEENIENSEVETNIDNFTRWWTTYLPNREVSLECMQEIIGKYIGPLSAVLTPKPGNQKERLLTFQHCVQHTQLALACNLLTRTQRNILEKKTKGQRRVYISGPPGSGKTVLLILKAHTFLEESEGHRVILVNMYRGAKGRAIGKHTFTTLSKHQNRIHHLQVNVGTHSFVEEVMKELKQAESREKSEGASSKPNEIDPKNVLFIVDEIYVESFWQEILDALSGEFAESEVWCAGLFSRNPTGFEEHELDFVLRCPPAVQNLLYHVDWDEGRKKKYRRDTEWIEVSTNGPIPLCVRHEHHVTSASTPVMDCAQCAEELAQILKNEHFVKKTASDKDPTQRAVSAPLPSTHTGGDASAVTSSPSDLKVVILVNMPRDKYSKSGNYIETTQEAYTSYMDYVKSCKFIKMLEAKEIKVDVKVDLGCKDMDPREGNDVTATWLYNFQGLEAGVVIYLPGDVSPGQQHSAPAREIPTPGLTTALNTKCTSRDSSEATESESSHLNSALEAEAEPPAVAVSKADISNNPTSGPSGSREEVHPVTDHTQSVPSTAGEDQVQLRPHLGEPRTDRRGGIHVLPARESQGNEGEGRLRSRPGETRATGGEGLESATASTESEDTVGVQLRSHPKEPGAVGGGRGATLLPKGTDNTAYSLTQMQWRTQDITRYSDWDKTNILVAGSRSLALIILMVP